MPSIRVRKRPSLYTSLEDDLAGRGRIQSASEGHSFLNEQDPVSQSRRARASSYTSSSNQRISRVSTHIANESSWRSADGLLTEHGNRHFPVIGTRQNRSNQHSGLLGSTSSVQRHPSPAFSTLSLSDQYNDDPEDHNEAVIDHLDVIDPQVSTVSNLTNAAHSIIIPQMSIRSWKPIVDLPETRQRTSQVEKGRKSDQVPENELDQHVEDVLSNRAKIRRTLRGVKSFLKTPLGIFTAIYGFLVAFWGSAIIFFLAKFINLHNTDEQGFWVEVSSQVVNGLFTLTGIGLIPLRVADTYRIYKIWHYKRRTRMLREKAGLPALVDEDDLPDPAYDPKYVHVLTDDEQKDLRYQQYQFMESQSWYRPHATYTHRAFPINTALLICCSIDFNSIFQIVLCGTMWGLDRFDRPAWSTGTLIPASFLCGILAVVLIWRGGQQTKRTAKVEERLRTALSMNVTSRPDYTTASFLRSTTNNRAETDDCERVALYPRSRSSRPALNIDVIQATAQHRT